MMNFQERMMEFCSTVWWRFLDITHVEYSKAWAKVAAACVEAAAKGQDLPPAPPG